MRSRPPAAGGTSGRRVRTLQAVASDRAATRHVLQRQARKAELVAHYDRVAAGRDEWIARNTGFYDDEQRYMRFLVPEGLRVLEIGCGTGQLLASLKPARGVGVDISAGMIEVARARFPH